MTPLVKNRGHNYIRTRKNNSYSMRKKSKKNQSNSQQLLALFLSGVALFMFLAILSYNLSDPVSLNVGSSAVETHNWLGPIGAVLAHAIIQWTFGYAALVFPVLLILFSINLFKGVPQKDKVFLALKLLMWALLISIYLAMPEALRTAGDMKEYYPSGLIGGWISSLLVLYLGKIGTILLVVFFTILLLFASLKNEIIQFFSSLTGGAKQIKDTTASKLQERKEARAKELEEKAKLEEQAINEQDNSAPATMDTGEVEPAIEMEFATEAEQPTQEENEADFNITDEPESFFTEDDSPDLTFSDPLEDATPERTLGEAGELDFEVKEEVQEEQLDYNDLVQESLQHYTFPSIELLNNPPANANSITKEELKIYADLLESKLLDYNVKAKVIRVTAGPVITLYELQPAAGVKVSSIVNLENDLALAMEARGIRIIAPIPGKAAIGIEIPNRNPQTVYLKSLIRSEKFNNAEFELPIAVGKAINGESFVVDLVKMPHLLIAGATGSGKSVGINTIICSLLYAVSPGKVKFVMIDPKKLELSPYAILKEHYLLWRPDLDEDVITKPNNAVNMLNTMVLEMERRMDRMHALSARNIREYNAKIEKNPKLYKNTEHQQMPYIVVIIDELADLMMVASKEVELPIARLAQMARAGGIHMIVATQRPSVDVITGLIKANLPARLAYQVATKVDSRTILDGNGADQLLGNGDLLFKLTGTAKPVRLQNPFVATEEVEEIIRHISKQPKLPYYSLPQPSDARSETYDIGSGGGGRDALYEDARAIVVQTQQGSISLLQRRLKIGYSRAARLIDEMEEEGVVGSSNGGKPREVIMSMQELNAIS